MSEKSERDAAIDAMVQAEILADGRDALQAQDRARKGKGKGGGGGYRGGASGDLDDSPGGSGPAS